MTQTRRGQSFAWNRKRHPEMFSYDGLITQAHQSATVCHIYGLIETRSLMTLSQQMLSAHSRPIDFPYQHFAIIYMNQNGQVELETSPSIESSCRTIFTSDVRERFMRTATATSSAASSFAGEESYHLNWQAIAHGKTLTASRNKRVNTD